MLRTPEPASVNDGLVAPLPDDARTQRDEAITVLKASIHALMQCTLTVVALGILNHTKKTHSMACLHKNVLRFLSHPAPPRSCMLGRRLQSCSAVPAPSPNAPSSKARRCTSFPKPQPQTAADSRDQQSSVRKDVRILYIWQEVPCHHEGPQRPHEHEDPRSKS